MSMCPAQHTYGAVLQPAPIPGMLGLQPSFFVTFPAPSRKQAKKLLGFYFKDFTIVEVREV